MGIEEKAKAYEMALEGARKELGVDRKEWEVVQQVLHNIFPELRESEDERIRKEIRNFLIDMECKKEWIAYMEKQKVLTCQPGNWSDADERMSHPLYLEGFDVGREVGKIEAEQKPVETSDFKTKLAEYLQNNSPKDGQYVISSESILEMAEEELIKRGELQKPAEWSEEDENMRNNILRLLQCFEGTAECESHPSLSTSYPLYMREIAWLKSLRPYWKPSEEQMKALEECGECKRCIKELYEQLKKL